jgi:GalNAc-alpha-(1->4)-GalNAc-alpha-(1->3)-diNAcBac-PP-undecaprenol alpha-1,4-N-acetyl-D-galactosaminyltransferase
MRVTLIISSLSSGGAERVITTMANYWTRKGWQITLLTMDDGSESPFYDLDTAVSHHPLGVASVSDNSFQGFVNNIRRLKVLRRAIRATAPQVVISFMDRTNVLVLASMLGVHVPIVVSERIDPRHHTIGDMWMTLRRLLYPRAAWLVVQTDEVLSYFSARMQVHARVIPNPVLPLIENDPQGLLTNNPHERKIILAMGRLADQKGFDLLIQAFAQVVPVHPDWSLEIWGDGPQRQNLGRLIEEVGLRDRAQLPGRTKQPFDVMRRSDLFVMSSRYEGFPNTLCEAMACGLPVVSFDCPSGPRAIVRDGIDGVLVPAGDVGALAEALNRLMNDEYARQRLAWRAPEVLARFGLEKVMCTWETLLKDVVR